MLLVVALLVALAGIPTSNDRLAQVRRDAAAAVRALYDGDLAALDKGLFTYLGQPDFAYYFTSRVTPRSLGDALATVAGAGAKTPIKKGIDRHAYDLTLTELAGTVALATHGTGSRALPTSWTDDFITATTTPQTLYGEIGDASETSAKKRADQDMANKQNLLLLLARGYWSTGFLMKATAVFWAFDLEQRDAAWPGAVLDDAKYAPAPNGTYLTDGVLALAAALTASPAASRWAFTEFMPGSTTIEYDGHTHVISKFAHYLFFEHKFPESGGESIGMTTTLTALSSAIGASGASDDGPSSDAEVLQAVVKSMAANHGGSILAKAWYFTKRVASAVWHWVQHWGHRVLDILSFSPPPFGTAAAGSNAVWYTIDGDYADAGLSLAAALPGLAFVKIAKMSKSAEAVVTAEAATAGVAKASRIKANWKSCERIQGGLVVKYGDGWTRDQRRAADEKIRAISAAAQRGELKKTVPERSAATAAQFRAGGRVPLGSDIDHIIDLQLGGRDERSNLQALDQTVNRSFGRQFEQQLKTFEIGAPISAVSICGR